MTDNYSSLTNKSNEIGMTTLNLDSLDTGQLQHIIKDDGLPHLYQRYAAGKLNAIELRLQGRIGKALLVESLIADIYSQMPIGLRW